jgi:hypothetical protein
MGFQEGRRAFAMEVDSTDKRSNGVKSRLIWRMWRTKKGLRDVTGDKNVLGAKINPSSRQIWKIDPPFFFPLVGVRLENKMVNTIWLPQKPIMILAIMLVRDFGVQPKEGREKRILKIKGINVNRRFRNDGRHITKRDGGGGAIIKKDVKELSAEESTERGMSMTVPARSMLEVGSSRSTQVPGGYNSSMGGLSSR